MERDRREPGTGYSRALLIPVTNGGATGGCPRRNVRSVNFESLSRFLAYQRVPRMACEAHAIGAGVTVGGEGAGAYDQ